MRRCAARRSSFGRMAAVVRPHAAGLALAEPAARGRFNVENVLCAVALALLLGVPLGASSARSRSAGAPPGRVEPIEAARTSA